MNHQFSTRNRLALTAKSVAAQLHSQGEHYRADQLLKCNALAHESWSSPRTVCGGQNLCPRCSNSRAIRRGKKLASNYEHTLQQHPRTKFLAFTGTLADVGINQLSSTYAVLRAAMRGILHTSRAMKGSYWQVETPLSTTQPGSVHAHVHAALFLPPKALPTAEEINHLWFDATGLTAASSRWEPVESPDTWSQYATKAEDLNAWAGSEYLQEYAEQTHRAKLHQFLN